MTAYSLFRLSQRDDVTVVQLLSSEESDSAIVSLLRDELIRLCEADKPTKLLVDFSQVERYPTEAISCLMFVQKRFSGAALKCCGLGYDIRLAYQFLNFTQTFETYESVEEGFASFQDREPAIPAPVVVVPESASMALVH